MEVDQIERFRAAAVEQQIGPKRPPGTAARWAERLREAAWKAGSHGTVTLQLPAYQAMLLATKLDMVEDRFQAKQDMDDTVEIAREAMKEEHGRFIQATLDLEMLLHDFFGRQPMAMEEVREANRQVEARDPKPISHRTRVIPVSKELTRSIHRGRVGNPREPGEEG